MKKTRSKKSRDTVPLIVQIFTGPGGEHKEDAVQGDRVPGDIREKEEKIEK